MGTAQRREREREEMRRRIMDAARVLFAREGYERVTMRRIAEAIEYSPTAIYHHFKDKESLLESCCEEDFGRLLEAFGEGGLPADPVERIRALRKGYARFALQNPNHYRFMFMTPPPECHDPDDAAPRSYLVLREAVEQGIAQGRLRDLGTPTVAQALWASLHGAIALLLTFGPDKFPVDAPVPDLVEQVTEATLRGLLVEERR